MYIKSYVEIDKIKLILAGTFFLSWIKMQLKGYNPENILSCKSSTINQPNNIMVVL